MFKIYKMMKRRKRFQKLSKNIDGIVSDLNEIKKIDIVPKAHVERTSFQPTFDQEIMNMLYLKSKHDNSCLAFDIDNMFENPIQYHITRHPIKGKQAFLNYNDIEIEKYIKSCLDNEKIKFIILPINILKEITKYISEEDKVVKIETAHSNMLIIDITHGIIERFEPHGQEFERGGAYNKKFNKLDDELKTYLNSIERLEDYEFLRPKDFCPRIGLQNLEEEKEKLPTDPGGFCLAWSVWYADLRLSNPNFHPKELLEGAIELIKIEYKKSFKQFIRNYAEFLYDFLVKMQKMK